MNKQTASTLSSAGGGAQRAVVELQLQNLGKRFNRHWIFRNISTTFQLGRAYAITGANGSGKSTLLQIIAGAMQHSEGSCILVNGQSSLANASLKPEDYYRHISIAAPYLELVEELTLKEFLAFHFQFKPILAGHSIASIIEYISLTDAADKQIRYYSSGMKQRVKLAQAIFSNTPVVLLDEPTTNLDTKGIELYHQLVNDYCKDRLLIVCSNDENEISFCKERLYVGSFKG